MSNRLGRGPLGSLARRAEEEVDELFRDNTVMARERHGVLQRVVRGWLVNRSTPAILTVYLLIVLLVVAAEVAAYLFLPDLLSDQLDENFSNFLLDVGSYLLAAQVGILAIVSVAVAVVTLLSQSEHSATVKTDVRLYYVESFSYELTTSSVALLLVLTFQLFWPVSIFVHAIGYGGPDATPLAVLTGVHATWFAFNVLLFLKFTTTTLRFVEPGAREHMRERYTANLVIPHDVRTRLFRAMYLNGPASIFGKEELNLGPTVSFGHGVFIEDDATVELERRFKRPRELVDVWLGPLAFAIDSWRRRTRAKGKKETSSPFKAESWDGELAIAPVTGHASDRWILVERRGGEPLLWWERLVLRHSLRFRETDKRDADLPTIGDLLEGLLDKMVAQIEKSAVTGFQAAFKEATRFHEFVLAAQDTRDEAGNALNLAEVGGLWTRPDVEWVRSYRRVMDAAAEKISVNTAFINHLSHLPYRLLPADAARFAPRPIITLVDLGPFQVIALEAWLTRHTLPTYNPLGDSNARLAGSDARAYQEVLISFVGAWESFQQSLILSFGLRKLRKKTAEEKWGAYSKAWGVIFAHLKASAYFIASASWNEDDPGEERYRDHLLRWLSHFYNEVDREYAFQHTYLLTPSLLTVSWSEASEAAKPCLRYHQIEHETPSSIFGEILRTTHRDAVTISAALNLLWYSAEQQATDIGARAASRLLRGETLDEGSDLTRSTSTPPSPFRAAFNLFLRNTIEPKVGGGRYRNILDELVEYLGGVASSRMVPGRVYSGWGGNGFDTIQRAVFAIMAAHMPPVYEDVLQEIAALTEEGGGLSEPETLRNALFYFERQAREVGETTDAAFVRAVRVFDQQAEPEALLAGLRQFFNAVATTLRQAQLAKLQAAQLDPKEVAKLRERMSATILADGPDIAVFERLPISRSPESQPVQEYTFGEIDKGVFFDPPMSALDRDDLVRIIIEASRDSLASYFWRDFYRRPRTPVNYVNNGDIPAFWRFVVGQAAEVGAGATVLVPRTLGGPVGQAAWGTRNVGLDEFSVERKPGKKGGGGIGYVGTLDGIDVFVTNDEHDAFLFSNSIAVGISYGSIGPNDEVVDFEFVGDDDPERSKMKLRYSQQVLWREAPLVHIHLSDPDSGAA